MYRDPFAVHEQYGIRPQWVYRKYHPETLKILGLQPTAIDQAIEDGVLPEPMPLTGHGKACGWMGWQLIEVMKKRLEAAQQRAAAKPKPLFKKKVKKGRAKNHD